MGQSEIWVCDLPDVVVGRCSFPDCLGPLWRRYVTVLRDAIRQMEGIFSSVVSMREANGSRRQG